MIRIELNPRRSRMRTTALSGLAIVLGLVALQVIDRHYPLGGIWRRVLDPAGETGEAAPYRRAADEDDGLVDASVGRGPTPDPEAADGSSRSLGDAPDADVVAPAATGGGGTTSVMDISSQEVSVQAGERATAPDPPQVGPRQSRAVPEALRLCERLPRGTHMSSLTCQAGGEYTLEGLAPPGSTVELFGFLDTLKGLPSDVSLSYWREGRSETEPWLTFTFEGRLLHVAGDPLRPVGEKRAEVLLGQIESRAHALGLAAVAVEPPTVLELRPGLVRHRQKCWATGPHRDLVAFVATLTQPGGPVSVGEIVVVPTQTELSRPATGGQTAARLRLYAAVDVLVADEAVAANDR